MMNAMKRIGLACAVLGLMVMAAGRSQAGLIYDNLHADTYSLDGGLSRISPASHTRRRSSRPPAAPRTTSRSR